MTGNVGVCDVAGIGGQMKEVRLICPTTPKLSHETERCLKPKLQLYTEPRNVTYILLCTVPLSTVTKQHGCQCFGCGLKSRGIGIGAAIRSTNF